MPEFFIQALGLGRLVLKRLQIHRPRQRCRPAAGLMPLAPWSNAGYTGKFVHRRYSTGRGAMQHDGIRLQQAGKKIGRDRHPARRDDGRSNFSESGWRSPRRFRRQRSMETAASRISAGMHPAESKRGCMCVTANVRKPLVCGSELV